NKVSLLMESVLKGSTMEERAQSLLETNIGSDCDFLVGSEENKVLFKANKIFLTKASPVFERMFYGGLQPSYPIEVPDIEPEVFHLMLNTGLIANERHLRNEVEDLIKYIRFLSMSSAEFAEGPGESDLLTTEEKLAILKTIVTNGNIPPPSNICPNWNPRKEAVM
ncbi:hypothetical protein ANN_21620, partial [Periplaneta americana]